MTANPHLQINASPKDPYAYFKEFIAVLRSVVVPIFFPELPDREQQLFPLPLGCYSEELCRTAARIGHELSVPTPVAVALLTSFVSFTAMHSTTKIGLLFSPSKRQDIKDLHAIAYACCSATEGYLRTGKLRELSDEFI